MRRASSGSRSARSSSEPFMSAKSTVTCLRSPSSVPREVRIFSARCGGVYVSGEAKRTSAGGEDRLAAAAAEARARARARSRSGHTRPGGPGRTPRRSDGSTGSPRDSSGRSPEPVERAGSGSRGASPRRVSASWRARRASAAAPVTRSSSSWPGCGPSWHRDHARELARPGALEPPPEPAAHQRAVAGDRGAVQQIGGGGLVPPLFREAAPVHPVGEAQSETEEAEGEIAQRRVQIGLRHRADHALAGREDVVQPAAQLARIEPAHGS